MILNFNDHGYTVCAYNRTVSKVTEFLTKEANGTNVIAATSIQDFASKLKRPRRVMLMVKAGDAVDEFINQLLEFLEPGDIIIDGGNSLYTDTERRVKELKMKGIFFVGCGVSGGEEGARHGPSMMPGGAPEAWPILREMFQSIAAKTREGESCCQWVGEGGAGHFVKMVHNGIEYGDMQLICEGYHMLRDGLSLSHDQMAEIFSKWNQEELDSFLIQITSEILAFKEEGSSNTDEPLVTRIRDVAGQKGTGKWTIEAALELGVPITLISEAVFARGISALKEERVRASQILPKPTSKFAGNKSEMIAHIKNVLTYC